MLSNTNGAKQTTKFPDSVPCLPTSAKLAPDDDRWLHEIKYDGYRMLCYVDRAEVRFISRNGKDWSDKLLSLADEISMLGLESAVLDGEVAMMAADGTTNFQSLQNHIGSGRDSQVRYYLFDLLYLNGNDVRAARLLDRKQLLQSLVTRENEQRLVISDHIVGNGPTVFQQACKLGMEGIVSKRIDSRYVPGRTTNWLKTKCLQSDDFVVAGYTLPSKSRIGLGALVLGRYDGHGNLNYVGRVGTGFTEKTLVELLALFEGMRTKTCPLSRMDHREKDTCWVIPNLIVEVEFGGWTNDGLIRFGVYRGIRDDLAPDDLDVQDSSTAAGVVASTPTLSVESAISIDLDGLDQQKLTSPDRIVYPALGITKLAVATYYARVANRMLPFIAGRPLSLLRCPKGIGERCFFQKRAPTGLHDSVERIEVSTSEGMNQCLVVRDISGLLALVQFGVLEFHVWSAKHDRIDRPDVLVIDLDPDETVQWSQVADAGLEIRDRLRTIGLKSYVKTTGGKGVHVLVPLRRRNDWEDCKRFATSLAVAMVSDSPTRYTNVSSIHARKEKIFIDCGRTSRGASFVAPYSTRARDNAAISVPITWDELRTIPNACSITIVNAIRRFDVTEDPWSGIGEVKQSITKNMLRALTR